MEIARNESGKMQGNQFRICKLALELDRKMKAVRFFYYFLWMEEISFIFHVRTEITPSFLNENANVSFVSLLQESQKKKPETNEFFSWEPEEAI